MIIILEIVAHCELFRIFLGVIFNPMVIVILGHRILCLKLFILCPEVVINPVL